MKTDPEDALKEAVEIVAQRYQDNDPRKVTEMQRAARVALLANMPAWNFVQGNLVDENRHLRGENKFLRVSVITALTVVTLAIVGVMLFVKPHYLMFPVDAKGKVAGQPIDSTFVPKDASEAEIFSRVLQFVPACFSGSLQPGINRNNDAVCNLFLSSKADKERDNYRLNNNGAHDPFALAKQGVSVDVAIDKARVQKLDTSWSVPWTETYRDASGKVIRASQNSATFQVDAKPELHSPENPFGVTVEDIHMGLAGAVPQ